MGDNLIHIILAVGGGLIGAIFSAGVVYTWVKMSIKRLEEKTDENFVTLDAKIQEKSKELVADLSGIGTKVGANEKNALRRYHNMSQAVQFVACEPKKKDVISILREF